MTTPDIILKLSNIESYYGPIMAIRGISLEVRRGQIVTLLGANGAGKTTVLKTISGILDPQKGTIEFLGKPIQRMEADRIVRLGITVLMVEHDMTLVNRVSDRVIALNYGRVLAMGTPAEVQRHPDVVAAYLGT